MSKALSGTGDEIGFENGVREFSVVIPNLIEIPQVSFEQLIYQLEPSRFHSSANKPSSSLLLDLQIDLVFLLGPDFLPLQLFVD